MDSMPLKTLNTLLRVVVEQGDHVVLFLVDKQRIREVEKLFHAPLSFT